MSTAVASTNATWNSETNTFTWTAENEYIVIPGLSGDLTGCFLDFTISDACHIDIVYTDDTKTEGGWGGYGRFGSGGSKTQDLAFMAGAKINSVKEVRICSQSTSGSLTVTSVSSYYPLKLNFDASGVATVPFNSITTSGGVTFDPATGVVTNTAGTGYLEIELPASGIDLSTIKRIDVTYTGEDDIWGGDDNRILKNLEIGGVNTWSGSRYSCDYTSYSAKSSNVKVIRWNAGGKTGGTLTFTSIKFTSDFLNCAKAGETVLNSLPWNKIDGSGTEIPNWNMNGTSDTYYGNYSGDPTHYADLTEYSELRVYCPDNTNGFRCFFINSDKSSINQYYTDNAVWHAEANYYSLDLSTIEKWDGKVALKAIKQDNKYGNPSGKNISSIAVYKAPAAGSAQYLITGKGLLDAATTTLLADATVTSIDVTGMTNVTTTSLTSANPNCLFIANSGKLSNDKNVIVSGNCANLALTDGYPFKAPANFTATAAPTYSRAFTASKTTTVCLPFALTSDEAASLGKFYEYSSFDGSTLHFSQVAAPEANTPYFVIPETTSLTLSEENKSIVATPAALKVTANNVDFIGTMEATTIPASDDDYSYYAYNNGDFVKITTAAATLPAFRAYFKVLNSAISSDAPALNICFDEFETTGIKDVKNAAKSMNGYYNLNGQKVAQPTKGLYIVNGKKVVIK